MTLEAAPKVGSLAEYPSTLELLGNYTEQYFESVPGCCGAVGGQLVVVPWVLRVFKRGWEDNINGIPILFERREHCGWLGGILSSPLSDSEAEPAARASIRAVAEAGAPEISCGLGKWGVA